jgi:stress-induced morphogen
MSTKSGSPKSDGDVERIQRALEVGYGRSQRKAKIEVYRYNPGVIRIRIIDPDFAGANRVKREDLIWPILDKLPDETVEQVTLVLLLTPKEATNSHASFEFDNPIPSTL